MVAEEISSAILFNFPLRHVCFILKAWPGRHYCEAATTGQAATTKRQPPAAARRRRYAASVLLLACVFFLSPRFAKTEILKSKPVHLDASMNSAARLEEIVLTEVAARKGGGLMYYYNPPFLPLAHVTSHARGACCRPRHRTRPCASRRPSRALLDLLAAAAASSLEPTR